MDPILIVDDEKDNLEALQRLLRNQFAITSTTSPFEALKAIQKQSFHIIVSDQRMPEMSGVELLEKARSISPNTTRILLTGYSDLDSIVQAINRGNIYRYVAKPWDPDDLTLTLRQANEAYQMRVQLEQKTETISKKNVELQKAIDDLRVLDKAKAKFLSLITHELNTPLTVLNSFIGLLAERSGNFPADLQKAISLVSAASDRFSEIISEVLAYVQVESDIQLHPQAVVLSKELTSIVSGLKARLEKKKVSVVRGSTDDATVNVDPQKFQIALKKLLDDALLRSPQGGRIEWAVKKHSNQAELIVTRQGDPVSAEAFEPLATAGKELNHHRSLGLALAICKTIVERHGGNVSLVSSDAKKTVISMLLPST